MRKRLPQAFASGKLSFIESSCQAFLQSQMGWLVRRLRSADSKPYGESRAPAVLGVLGYLWSIGGTARGRG